MINNWRDKHTWENIQKKSGEQFYLFRMNLATPEELETFFKEVSEAGIEGTQKNSESSYSLIRKGDLVFSVSGESIPKLIDVWLPKYETFYDLIRLRQKWDEVLIFVNRQPRSGFRTKIDGIDPEEVEKVKEYLKEFMVDAHEEISTFDSENIKKGDKVLMVSNPISSNNLRRVWALEKEKNTLPKPFKPRPRKGKKGKFSKGSKGKFGKNKGKSKVPFKKQPQETVEIDYSEPKDISSESVQVLEPVSSENVQPQE